MRAEICKTHLFQDDSAFEDYEYWTRLAPFYRMGNVPRMLIKHRQHANQSHILEAEDFQNDLHKYSLEYFHGLFPGASATDHTVMACMVRKKPLDSLKDIELAGTWLMRLAQTPDRFLRQRMADRWTAACRRSAHLGFGCYRLYRRMAPRFEVPEDGKARVVLLLACASRLKADSKAYNVFGGLKGAWASRRKFFRKNNR